MLDCWQMPLFAIQARFPDGKEHLPAQICCWTPAELASPSISRVGRGADPSGGGDLVVEATVRSTRGSCGRSGRPRKTGVSHHTGRPWLHTVLPDGDGENPSSARQNSSSVVDMRTLPGSVDTCAPSRSGQVSSPPPDCNPTEVLLADQNPEHAELAAGPFGPMRLCRLLWRRSARRRLARQGKDATSRL